MVKRQVIFLLALFFLIPFLVWPQEGLLVPEPPESTFVDTHQMSLGILEVSSWLYSSPATPEEVIEFYQAALPAEGFAITHDQAAAEQERSQLKGQRDDWEVTIAVAPGEGETRVTISQYLQGQLPQGQEELEPSWQDLLTFLPQEDVVGWDLEQVPRPPDSVRVSFTSHGPLTHVSYTSSWPPEDIVEFYKREMEAGGFFQLGEDIDTSETLQRYAADDDPEILELSPGLSFASIAEGGYILYFVNQEAQAELNLLRGQPADEGPEGTLVNIAYSVLDR